MSLCARVSVRVPLPRYETPEDVSPAKAIVTGVRKVEFVKLLVTPKLNVTSRDRPQGVLVTVVGNCAPLS